MVRTPTDPSELPEEDDGDAIKKKDRQTPLQIVEEALSSGCSEDQAAGCAGLTRHEYLDLLAEQLKGNPEWLNRLIMKSHSIIGNSLITINRAVAQKSNPALALEVMGRKDPSWSPKQFNITPPDQDNRLTEEEREKLDTLFPNNTIPKHTIEAEVTPYAPSDTRPEPESADTDSGADNCPF